MGQPIEQPIEQTVGKQLRAIREQKGFSGYRVSQITRYSTSFLSRVELDKALPPLSMVYRLAELYEIDPAPLVEAVLRKKMGKDVIEVAANIAVSDAPMDDIGRWIHALVDVKNQSPTEAKARIHKAMGFLSAALKEIDDAG